MQINGKVHCLFEQSGTFKSEFKKLGYPAYDYDIQNNYNETDNVIDLFAEIEKAYTGGGSIFDKITSDDLIIAFFPCIYFSTLSQISMYWGCCNYKKLTIKQKTDKILERANNRLYFYTKAIQMLAVAKMRGLRLIMENPYTEPQYLKNNFVTSPALIDYNRTLRGDAYKKPTAYWFINCEPTNGESYTQPKQIKKIFTSKSAPKAGICSEERSMITADYARNFICDFILGKKQTYTELTLF